MTDSFIPADYQLALPQDELILREPPSEEAVPMDVVFVGGGPAGLAGAIELARLVEKEKASGGALGDVEIGVLEKSERPGEHCLSGAVVNPAGFRELYPELSDSDFPFRNEVTRERVYLMTQSGSFRLPTPPTMNNHGNYVASICECVKWLADKAEALGVNLFAGFPADALLVDEVGGVRGVRTTASGLDKGGKPGPAHMPPTDVTARVTVLSEGTRGPLAQAYNAFKGIDSPNPQIFALGVKELWQTKRPLDAVVHTLGWPLPRDAFGGSFAYPMAEDLIAIGLVVGLDYRDARLDVHHLLQRMKTHPLYRPYLEGGELLEWGAKTIPEGGYHSLASRLHGDGILMVGDTAGFVDVPSLKGIHYAMLSGIYAARTIFSALKADDCTAATLASYDESVKTSVINDDLYRTRNMRLGFKSGFFSGGLKAGLMTLSGGAIPGGKVSVEQDAADPKTLGEHADALKPDGELTFSKLDGVFRSGNNTRDDMPSHLMVREDLPTPVQTFYEHMCPAGVYERRDGQFVVNYSNCVDCKAADVVGPRWKPREGGSGTKYKRM